MGLVASVLAKGEACIQNTCNYTILKSKNISELTLVLKDPFGAIIETQDLTIDQFVQYIDTNTCNNKFNLKFCCYEYNLEICKAVNKDGCLVMYFKKNKCVKNGKFDITGNLELCSNEIDPNTLSLSTRKLSSDEVNVVKRFLEKNQDGDNNDE